MTEKAPLPPMSDALIALLPAIINEAREAARALGYAIALHGSYRRDIDLLAVPWTEDAAPAADLVEAVRVAVAGMVVIGKEQPALRPHGRLAWTIHLAGYGPTWIDLSVMPRRP